MTELQFEVSGVGCGGCYIGGIGKPGYHFKFFGVFEKFGSRRTARREAPKPEMATKMVSGIAMFPPMAVKL